MEDLEELAWAVLLLDLMFLLCGTLWGSHLGRNGWLLGVGLAALATGTLAMVAAANLLLIWALRLRDRRRARESTSPLRP